MTLLDKALHSIQVLCKDCGKDVGWTGEHHCSNQQRPQLPTLCSSTSSQYNDSSDDDQLPDPTYITKQLPRVPVDATPVENGRWSFFRSGFSKPVKPNLEDEPSVYYDTYAAQLSAPQHFGKSHKVRENEKWKELINEKKEEKKGKLWDKWFQPSETSLDFDNCEADSDREDWDGETHISRILREYYQNKHEPLPEWLVDDKTPISALAYEASFQKPQPRSQKLWQVDTKMTKREQERMALRQKHFEEGGIRPKSVNDASPKAKVQEPIRRTRTAHSKIP